MEYFDEGSATVAKDALHNYKLDGENKIKVRKYQSALTHLSTNNTEICTDYICTEVKRQRAPSLFCTVMYNSAPTCLLSHLVVYHSVARNLRRHSYSNCTLLTMTMKFISSR